MVGELAVMQFVPLLHSLTTSRMRNDLSGKDSNHGREEVKTLMLVFGAVLWMLNFILLSIFCFIFRDKIHDLIKLGKLLDTHTFIPL